MHLYDKLGWQISMVVCVIRYPCSRDETLCPAPATYRRRSKHHQQQQRPKKPSAVAPFVHRLFCTLGTRSVRGEGGSGGEGDLSWSIRLHLAQHLSNGCSQDRVTSNAFLVSFFKKNFLCLSSKSGAGSPGNPRLRMTILDGPL